MKILVPVDFRNTSFAAYCYANQLADELNGEITLIHVISAKTKINEYLDGDLLMHMKDVSRDRLLDFAVEYPKQKGIKLKEINTKYIVGYGEPGEEIIKTASSLDYDMIIMGIRDKINFMARLTGTTATDVMNGSGVPVIMVHANSRYNLPKKVVFAFDKLKDLEDSVEAYMELNNRLRASTDFVHVLSGTDNDIIEMTEEIIDELFDDDGPTFSFQIKTLQEENVIKAVQDYCLFEKADLLVMTHRKDSHWNLFLNNSKTVKTAHDFHLPLLVLPN